MSDADVRYRARSTPSKIPFVPTPPDVVELMLAAASPMRDEFLYDLGCGDGRILREAVSQYGCIGVGYEIDRELASYALSKARRGGLKHGKLHVIRKDLNKAILRRADVVTLYLTPDALLNLRPALEAQLQPGVRVVSHDYKVRGWIPDSVEEMVSRFDGKRHTVFLYRIPSKIERYSLT